MAGGAAWGGDWRWLRHEVPDARNVIAVVGHGPAATQEPVADAPFEIVIVTHLAASGAQLERATTAIERRWRAARVEVRTLEAHRVRWLRPGVLQQSLVASGRTLWGDEATLAAVPRWPATQIDPRAALDEQDAAERELAAGRGAVARWRAVGGLLIARRSFVFPLAERAAAVRTVWPELGDVETAPAARMVERARRLLDDWLFTWEGEGPPPGVRDRYAAGWRAASAAGARPG